MSFRIADVEALLLAGLICGLFSIAKAQSTDGQHIVFSSPEGQITSNAPLPMVQAPEAQDSASLPSGELPGHQFSAPTPPPMFFQPPPMLPQDNPRIHDDFRDPMNVRKGIGDLTPAQIMNVPTAEEIFGLAEKPDGPQKRPGQLDNGETNIFASDTNAIFAEPGWAKAWSDDPGKSPGAFDTGSSNTTARASGFFGEFFDSARNDNRISGRFGNHDANNPDTLFSPSQSASQQSSWDSGLTSGTMTPTAHASGSVPINFAAPATVSSSIFASQSPFSPPQANPLDTLPQLPTLPTLPGQNSKSFQPATTTSWAPKPPPWTVPQTPLGTPVH
ncbi:MAG TPA: hypothetical protein VGJ73_07850 [Verrucomicrobiae bacterium]|jgi:hypothetical protein